MRCPKCGKTLDASAKICPVCRTQIASANAHSSTNVNIDHRPNTTPASSVVRSSESFGGSGSHRCSKCGKVLDASAKICPVCRTQLMASVGTDNTVKITNSQRKPEPPAVHPQPVNINTTAAAKGAQQQRINKRSKKPVVIAVAVASAVAVIAIAVIGLNLLKKDKGEDSVQTSDSQSYETVNSKLSEVLSSSETQEDSEKLKQQVGSTLDDLAKDGMVKDVKYVVQTSMYEFTYDDGTQGGVMLEPFQEGVNGTQKSYVQKQSGEKVESFDNKVNLDKSKYSYSKNPKVKIMYGLGFDDVLSCIKERNDVWKNEGLTVEMDEDCTAKDLADDLDGYDYIQIEEHGSLYDGVPVICLDEDVTEENRKEYSKDLNANNIVGVHCYDSNHNIRYQYWIKPSFFKEHYGSKGLSGSIVYLGCCHGYQQNELVDAIKNAGADTVIGYTETVYTYYDYYIQDAFVYSLMYGDTVSEALKYAESIWGTDDIRWINTYYSDSHNVKPEIAKPKVLGNTSKTLVTIKNTETTVTATQKPEEKPVEKPVPDIINKMLEYTEPDYGGQPGGPAAAFMTYYGYRGHEGTEQDVMWFQDMDGDNVPDLVVGGYSVAVDGIQGMTHCFQIQLSNGNGGGTVHLLLDNSSKSKHGHEAFMMQAYKDKNGTLMFTHTQFYAYTSPDPQRDPNYAGAFTIYEYSFANGKTDDDKKQILYYTHDPRQGSSENAFSCTDSSGKKITASAAKQIYNNYFSSKTPLSANIKTINYQKYMREMNQQQRKQALMDSYYAFSYTENKSIAPYGKEVFDKMPSAAAATTTTRKPQDSADAMYASYASAAEGFKSRNKDANETFDLFVCDIDNDGVQELCLSAMYGIIKTSVEIFKYNSASKKAECIATGDVAGCIWYSLSQKKLISTYTHPCGLTTETPSGATTDVYQISTSGKSFKYNMLFSADPSYAPGKQKLKALEPAADSMPFSKKGTVSASEIKANAVKNKAA